MKSELVSARPEPTVANCVWSGKADAIGMVKHRRRWPIVDDMVVAVRGCRADHEGGSGQHARRQRREHGVVQQQAVEDRVEVEHVVDVAGAERGVEDDLVDPGARRDGVRADAALDGVVAGAAVDVVVAAEAEDVVAAAETGQRIDVGVAGDGVCPVVAAGVLRRPDQRQVLDVDRRAPTPRLRLIELRILSLP